MSDQVLIAVISTLGSIIVAYITATANTKKTDNKENVSELKRLKQENARLRSRLDNKRKGQK